MGKSNLTFLDGQKAAKKEYAKSPTTQLCLSIGGFAYDPPDSPFQHGYLDQLYKMLKTKLGENTRKEGIISTAK
jgi:hypothetical protein